MPDAAPFPYYAFEERDLAAGDCTIRSVHGPRFDAEARERISASLARDARRFLSSKLAEAMIGSLSDCHNVFLVRSGDMLTALATATWRHTAAFRYLHLCIAAEAGRDLPREWLGICLGETARFVRNEMPAIIVLEVADPLLQGLKEQVAALPGTVAMIALGEDDLQAALGRCVLDTLSAVRADTAIALPLCVLVAAQDQHPETLENSPCPDRRN